MKISANSTQQLTPGRRFFFSRIFPLIFIVVGASVAFFGIRGLQRAKASTDWPAVQGVIRDSSVERKRSSGSNSSTTYHAEILYEFTVNGTVLNGDRVAYGDYGSSSPAHARQVVNRYPRGKQVAVYYMPENPEECLLEPGLQTQAVFLPVFGAVFFGAGLLMAIKLPKQMRPGEAGEPESHTDLT